MISAIVWDAVRTPIGRYGGALSTRRTDNLAAIPIKTLMDRNPDVDRGAIDDVILSCANQAAEDNRNVARMATLLAGYRKPYPERRKTGFAARDWTRSEPPPAPFARATPPLRSLAVLRA